MGQEGWNDELRELAFRFHQITYRQPMLDVREHGRIDVLAEHVKELGQEIQWA
jgi:hypothetical protein